MSTSISFDRAAESYDATRALPDPIQRRLIDALEVEFSRVDAEQVLEVGVGTGRIARPLAERGLRVCGVDIAPRMLARFREQTQDDHVSPDLLLGDVTSLPVASGSFQAVLAIHLFHLVPAWRSALEEMRRALAACGVLIHYNERYVSESKLGAASIAKWDELLSQRNFTRRVRPRPEEIHSKLRELGGSCRKEAVAEGEDRRTPAAILEVTRRRINSWTWEIPDELFFDCLEGYEQWLRDQYEDMSRELVDRVFYELEVWSFD